MNQQCIFFCIFFKSFHYLSCMLLSFIVLSLASVVAKLFPIDDISLSLFLSSIISLSLPDISSVCSFFSARQSLVKLSTSAAKPSFCYLSFSISIFFYSNIILKLFSEVVGLIASEVGKTPLEPTFNLSFPCSVRSSEYYYVSC